MEMGNRRYVLRGLLGGAMLVASAGLNPIFGAAFRRTEWGETSADAQRNRASLRRGWAAMKARPKPANPWEDPYSIDFFVWLHDLRGAHRGYFFLPWHAGFIWWFEQAIRTLSGDPEFALPYIDFSKNRVLPADFRDRNSPFYHPRRNSSVNGGTALPLSAVQWENSIRVVPFTTSDGTPNFGGLRTDHALNTGPGQGALESQPHGPVHIAIGGDMADLATAPADILFYLHHGWIQMLVRFWRSRGGQYPTETSDPNWLYNEIMRFPNANGDGTDKSVSRILGEDFPYQYTFPTLSSPTSAQMMVAKAATGPAEILVSREADIILPSHKTTTTIALRHPARSNRILLTLSGMSCIVREVYHEVYVGLPTGTTPSPTGQYYVGNVALVAHGGVCGGVTQVLDVTRQLAGKSMLKLTLVPRGPASVLNSHASIGTISKLVVKG